MAPKDTITVRAVAFSHAIQSRSLAWPPPLQDLQKAPDRAEFVWRRMQYIFDLADPAQWQPGSAPVAGEVERLIARFVAQAERLAQTSFLAANDVMRVSIPDFGGEELVETEFADDDVTTGFMVFLRQCYSDDEEASFSKVRKVSEKHLHEAGDVAGLEILKTWRKAHATLRNQGLEELVQEQMVRDKLMPGEVEGPEGEPESGIVRGPAAPAELLRTFWYGDQIHWGKTRDALDAIYADPYEAAHWNISARQAAVDLAQFYLGYGTLVRQLLPG